jgi:hypothetical protein
MATFIAYFSLFLFLLVMYLRYQHLKNQLLAARRRREVAFLQQMSQQFKRKATPPPPQDESTQ